MKIVCNSLNELDNVAKTILTNCKDKKVFALYGKMGAGKTTLTKSFCKVLNVIDVVNSPTFAIINEYLTDQNNNVYHFDCYRLKNVSEFLDIGGEEYFYSDNYCFIEWPQIIEDLLPEDCIKVYIEVDDTTDSSSFDSNKRIISYNGSNHSK
ncbi:MAG: tRNA (adenosine(37)-N6)-threonylcarbamoyltransferase complex ATPase subunit type 1 TsaE [Bacteroidales bacterium]|jgi:tRNA threonylcarbamoyladenosine biosynthesis protein TsaE